MGELWRNMKVNVSLKAGYERSEFWEWKKAGKGNPTKEDLLNYLIDKLIAGRVITIYAQGIEGIRDIQVEPPKVEIKEMVEGETDYRGK